MSSDRLARMKAERDRARGIQQSQQSPQPAQGQQAYQQPQYPGQQQQQYPADAQSQPYAAQPTMYPAQQGQGVPVSQAQQQGVPMQGGIPGQGGQYGQQQQPMLQNQQMDQQQMNAPAGPVTDMNAFFAEIDNINGQLTQLKSNIGQINNLHNAVLNSTINEQRQEQAQSELTQLTNDTSRLTNQIKLRIKNLSESNDRMPNVPGSEGEKNTRRMQVQAQKTKFMEYIQEYREVEKKSRDRYKARMERQMRIVKPDISDAEVKQAIETDQGSQVFANALTQSTRYADARTAYREVQERHEDIKRIAQTMTELQELFNDMAMLVEQQDGMIQTVEANAVDVENNMEQGHLEIEKGKVKAKKARRKRVWCFWIIIILIIAIVLAVTLSILSRNGTI